MALTANFIFVARDSKTGKAAPVNRLSPVTKEEKSLYEEAKARSITRKMKSGDAYRRELENGEANRLQALLAEGRIFCHMPALADRNSILLSDTRLENALICQPQQRNIHGRIFGGFLMHRAFELAFSTAYAFAGLMPFFLEVDHVDFLRPVSDFQKYPCFIMMQARLSWYEYLHVCVVMSICLFMNRWMLEIFCDWDPVFCTRNLITQINLLLTLKSLLMSLGLSSGPVR